METFCRGDVLCGNVLYVGQLLIVKITMYSIGYRYRYWNNKNTQHYEVKQNLRATFETISVLQVNVDSGRATGTLFIYKITLQ
jgi:hypothetical protein